MAPHRFMPEVVYDYVEELDANLVCAICQSALVDPVTTTSCKHTFCRDCIERAIAVNPQCPIDRSALTTHSLRETEQLVKLMLDELKVRCAADGCGVVMQRGLLLAHLRTCPMAVTMCEDGECGLKMPKQRVSEHRAYECFQRKMECERCGVFLTFKDQTPRHLKPCASRSGPHVDHNPCEACGEKYDTSPTLHQWACPSARVPCTHTTRGCPAIIPRSELDAHLKLCPFEAMSAFFIANDARFQAMEERQEVLVKEVAMLRSGLQAERALAGTNGWRVSEGRYLDLRGEPMLAGETARSDARATRPGDAADSGLSPSDTLDHPSETVASTTGPQNTASPPPAGITARAAADFAAPRSLFSPSFGSRQSYADWAFHHLSDPMPSTLAALEVAVSRLRRVVLQLASGLDTMERRNEVRTMTESLRILEEVGALRAIVNTIRLQVMIDRQGTPRHRRSFGMTSAPTSNPIPRSASQIRTEPAPSRARGQTTDAQAQSGTAVSAIPISQRSVSSSVTGRGHSLVPPHSGPGSSVSLGPSSSRTHIWALNDISHRRARRDANTIGGVGGIVGEPMGMPRTPEERGDPMDQTQGARSMNRLSRAVSNGFLSIRSAGRRSHGTGPRL